MLALVISVGDPADAELAADALWSLGVVAVEERVGEAGGIELWTSLGDDRSSIEQAMRDSVERIVACRWRFEEVDESVADSWRAFARPSWIDGGLVIWPAWLQATSVPDRDIAVVSIEPGATFGTGDHPTTVLSLRALRRVLSDRPRATVLDVGCGSGVLAVTAAVLGARSAHGIDISPAAVPVTIDNARRNGVAELVSVSTDPLHDVTGSYDVVVANILAPALIELSADLLRVLAHDGWLVVSGVLVDGFDHVMHALAPMRVTHVDELDGWAAVTLRR